MKMKTYDFSKNMSASHKIALNKYAKRMESDEMTIHKDNSITLVCEYGYICEHYYPTQKELRL